MDHALEYIEQWREEGRSLTKESDPNIAFWHLWANLCRYRTGYTNEDRLRFLAAFQQGIRDAAIYCLG